MSCAAMIARFAALAKRPRLGRRGAVTIMFACAALPILIAVMTAVDISRMTSARSALQQAADDAALSGAAVYTAYTQGDAFNAVARAVATSAFCNATTSVPAGFALIASNSSTTCGPGAGPSVTAVIAGAQTGTRGVITNAGCSATNTVVSGATCGFVVTVSVSARMNSIFPAVLGATETISVTSSAINPFINIATALSAGLQGSAKYANSIWVYPLLLDQNGSPAVTSANPGALPDASACTGDPTQTSCGAYSMLASTNYQSCPTQTTPACTVNGTTFGAGGVVQNPSAGAVVITATTPLGVAFESSSGGGYAEPAGVHQNYGYDRAGPYYGSASPYTAPGDSCVWPWHTVYNTVSQVYSPSGAPTYPWSLVTHWFYSSYLLQNMPPSQGMVTLQQNSATNPATGYPYLDQVVHSTPQVISGVNTPTSCTTPAPTSDYEIYSTTYPSSGSSNCSLYIARDPASLTPNSGYVGSCFNPASTPGQSYAVLSCQNFAGHSFAFFWNDMGGGGSDDMNYGNGTLVINCVSQPRVRLIN